MGVADPAPSCSRTSKGALQRMRSRCVNIETKFLQKYLLNAHQRHFWMQLDFDGQHTHKYTHTNTDTHTHIHTHTQAHEQTPTHKHTDIYTQTPWIINKWLTVCKLQALNAGTLVQGATHAHFYGGGAEPLLGAPPRNHALLFQNPFLGGGQAPPLVPLVPGGFWWADTKEIKLLAACAFTPLCCCMFCAAACSVLLCCCTLCALCWARQWTRAC
jgi:hypothetical protein